MNMEKQYKEQKSKKDKREERDDLLKTARKIKSGECVCLSFCEMAALQRTLSEDTNIKVSKMKKRRFGLLKQYTELYFFVMLENGKIEKILSDNWSYW